MILDQWEKFRELDPEGMLGEIDTLPSQLQAAWRLGASLGLPDWSGIRRVVVAGMGGSAIGADLLQAYIAPRATMPLLVWRDYELPAFAMGSETLVIASSHSGETEEVLSAFERALAAGTKAMAITTGGTLGERAQAADAVLWTFDHNGAPRAAVGYSFALLLAALTRLALIPDPSSELQEAVRAMREQEAEIGAQVAVVHNPAKRMAGQLVGRMPTFIGADILAPVARRWCTQVNELAKAAAHFGFLPEVDHNLVAGVSEPQELLGRSMVVFLQGTQTHPRDQVRVEVTREALMLEGLGTDVVTARGESRLAQQWTSLHFGDYTAFYLAMSYGVDPSPVDSIETLKGALRRRELDGE